MEFSAAEIFMITFAALVPAIVAGLILLGKIIDKIYFIRRIFKQNKQFEIQNEKLEIQNADLFVENAQLAANLEKYMTRNEFLVEKANFFDRFISPAYRMLDSDKEALCMSLNITKKAYDKELDNLSDEGLEETLLTYRVHDRLLNAGYLYSKKFKNRYSTIECENCNLKINKLVEDIQDLTQSECKCAAERYHDQGNEEALKRTDNG